MIHITKYLVSIKLHFVCFLIGFNFIYKFLSNKKVAQDFAMSDFSLILVLQIKTSVNRNKTWQRYK